MKTDEHEKSMNADPEDVEGDPDIVKNQAPLSAAASRIQGPGNQTAPAGPPSGVTKSGFMSVSLSKAHGSPCAPKPTSEDKGPMWVGGKTSKEVPREEEGEYTPPGWSDKDDEDDKKKDVKKSFVSAQLSKGIVRSTKAEPPISKTPVGGSKTPSPRPLEMLGTKIPSEGSGWKAASSTGIVRQSTTPSAAHSRVIGTRKPTFRETLQEAPKPRGFTARARAYKGSPAGPMSGEVREGELARTYRELPKSAKSKTDKRTFDVSTPEGRKEYAAAMGVDISQLGKTATEALAGEFAGKRGGDTPPIEDESAHVGTKTARNLRNEGIAIQERRAELKAEDAAAKEAKKKEAQEDAAAKEAKKKEAQEDAAAKEANKAKEAAAAKEAREKSWQEMPGYEEGVKKKSPRITTGTGSTRKSLTELRYGSQLARNHDIGKSCGMCGRISKSCGDHEGGGCCEDCKKSMSSVNWHDSHLS